MYGFEIGLCARYAQSVHSKENYSDFLDLMFLNRKYTLTKVYVLRELTLLIRQRRPLIEDDIRNQYNSFIYDHFEAEYFLKLFI